MDHERVISLANSYITAALSGGSLPPAIIPDFMLYQTEPPFHRLVAELSLFSFFCFPVISFVQMMFIVVPHTATYGSIRQSRQGGTQSTTYVHCRIVIKSFHLVVHKNGLNQAFNDLYHIKEEYVIKLSQ